MDLANRARPALPEPDDTTTRSAEARLLARPWAGDVAALAILGVLAVGIPLWLAAAAGAIGIPSGDDWVYMRGASSLYQTGRIDMPGHNAAAVGQLVLVQPLLWLSVGDRWAFTAFGLLFGLVGVVATYLLARRFVGVGPALLVGLLVIVFPGFAREMATFVTDVPAYALGTLCLLLGVRWLQGDGGRLALAASLVVGVLAVSIREFALAAPVAILIAAWLRNRADERVELAIASVAFALGVVGVFLVADSIPGRSVAPAGALSLPILIVPAFVMLAFALLPASIVGFGRRLASLAPIQLAVAAVFVLAAMVLASAGPFLWGYLAVAGGSPDALLSGTRSAVIAAPAWTLVEVLALLSAVLAATLLLRWALRNLGEIHSLHGAWQTALRIARGSEGPLLILLVLYAGGLAAFGSLNSLYDRYLWPLVPPAAILLLRPLETSVARARSWALASVALAFLGVIAVAVTANSVAYDTGRWRAGAAATALGYEPATVDAGYEWVGFHALEGAPPHDYGLMWYDSGLSSRPCAVLSNSPLDKPGFILIREDQSAYRQYLFVGPEEPLYLYGSTAAGCPAPPKAGATTKPGSG